MKNTYNEKRYNNFREIVNDAAKNFGDKAAFIRRDGSGSEPISFNQLKERYYRLCSFLISAGLKGESIAVVGRNCFEWVVSYLAAATVGTVVPIDRELKADDIKAFSEAAHCKMLIHDGVVDIPDCGGMITADFAQIYALSAAHKFDEAQTVSRDALIRYPHDFSIIYTSAFMLQITAFEKEDMKAARQAIKLYEDAKDHLSQNNDPNINEFTINLNIASCYAFFDEKKAIKIFKENNFAGISDAVMSFTYLKMGETEESLKCSTKGIIKNLFGLLNCASYMIIALTMRRNIKSTDSAFELCENSLTLIRMFKTKETGYLSKFEALFFVMKAYIHAISGNEDMMEACLKEGKRLARQYDKSSSNNIAEDLKFYYDKKETVIGYDSLGESAVEGIRKTINENIKKIPQIDQGLADLISQKWDTL